MAKVTTTRKVNAKRYPGTLGKMVVSCYDKKMSAKKTAEKLNASKTAQRLGVEYSTMSIAGTFAAWSRTR